MVQFISPPSGNTTQGVPLHMTQGAHIQVKGSAQVNPSGPPACQS